MRPFLTLVTILTMATFTSLVHAKVVTQRIEYKDGETVLEGVLAYDDAVKGGEKRPGILVCPEWWGCNSYAQKRAEMLAEQGYVAFAIDMYGKGKTTEDPKQAAAWAGEITKDPAALRARAAKGLEILVGSEKVDSARLGAIGYCMGGTVALELARSGLPNTEKLKAITAFHASTIAAKKPEDNKNIKGSVLICHGALDNFVQPDQIPAFEKQMDEAKIDFVLITYAGAKHAFTNPNADKHTGIGVAYNKLADERSWRHMTDFLKERFGAK